MSNSDISKSPGWIVIEDEIMTAATLETAVEKRLTLRRAALGRPSPLNLPAFGHLSPMPEPPQRGRVSPTLYHHLRQLNEMDAPDARPDLRPSPATSIPILGRLWAMIRAQAHQLVLFYVNRALAHETTVNNHTLNALNELTRLAQSQQEEINRLQEELEQRRKNNNRD